MFEARNSVDSSTDPKSDKDRSKPKYEKMSTIEKENSESGSKDDNEDFEIEATRGRGSSIKDKVSIFSQVKMNKLPMPVTSESDLKALPIQNFKKVFDDKSNKIKWVAEEKNYEEGEITSRRVNNKEEVEPVEEEPPRQEEKEKKSKKRYNIKINLEGNLNQEKKKKQ